MYAVVRTGGKQYVVREGEELLVERLTGEKSAAVTLKDVLFVGGEGQNKLGRPTVAGAQVQCRIVDQERGPKLTVFRFRKRKNSRKKNGHRQELTRLLIEKIQA